MRLGGNVFYNGTDPEEYALLHVKKGYGAALCPDFISLDDPVKLQEFKAVMKEHDIVIAEVGAWCNPLHPDKEQAEANVRHMINRLRLAEELEGALLFLVNEKAAGFITGVVIPVDGGFSAYSGV